MASKELLLFCTCRAACTMSSRVCAPGKCLKNSWFSIFSALRTPCLRECAHHVFGSVRPFQDFLEISCLSILLALRAPCLRECANLAASPRNSCFSVLFALRTPRLRECAHLANVAGTLGFPFSPRYVHHVFGSVRTFQDFLEISSLSILLALRTPCLRECAHHVFGSVRTLKIFLKSLAFPYHTMSSRVCAHGKFLRNSWFSIFSALRTPWLRECAHRARYFEN